MILKQLRRVHLAVGIVTFAVFLVSGMAMSMMFPAVYAGREVVRYLYRLNHIDLLFAALLNLAVGTYLTPSEHGVRRVGQLFGSACVLGAPAVFVWAFVVEPALATSHRPRTLVGVVLCLVGVGLHALTGRASPGATA
jgi:hypothetical protein